MHTMDLLIIGFLILSITSFNSWVGVHGQSTFDVLQYGAKGDGHSDDSQAFLDALKALCGSSDRTPTLVGPEGHSFFVRPINFTGPCQSQNVHIKINGTLLAPKRNDWEGCSIRWIYFFNITGMTLDGSGVFNGQCEGWWSRVNGTGGCPRIPTALTFEKCDGLQISELTHINGPGGHISVVNSQDVTISHIHINSPKGSHNTDGIDITRSTRVNIHDITIESGDDCVAIKGGSQFINVSQVTCDPGHGISMGSLGVGCSTEFVEHLIVKNCTFNGADSAVKIKTWPGGKGYAKAIIFEDIRINQTNYPIYIQQHYMHTPEKKEAVKVSDVIFSNIYGTCINENAIVLDCAKIGCDNITLHQINITSIDQKNPASAICKNAHGTSTDIISPRVPCVTEIMN